MDRQAANLWIPNPGSGAEVLALRDGNWVLIHNDLERDRYSLAVSLSEDEGRTWRWTRHLERDADTCDPQRRGQYHYPSIIQAADGTLHATYSYFAAPATAQKDAEGASRARPSSTRISTRPGSEARSEVG